MWEPQLLATLRASTACTGITLPLPLPLFHPFIAHPFRTHCTFEISLIFMKFTYISMFIWCISHHLEICIFIKATFEGGVGLHGNFTPTKVGPYFWVSQFSMCIWEVHNHFCKFTFYWAEKIRAYTGTVIQVDQAWFSPLYFAAFIKIHTHIILHGYRASQKWQYNLE
jgi:hypothetical protein